ncbi:MAG: DEAD/DEAH box helicase [Spirochaetaceae bacterium]|nr:DEAD/DEAH box helicase [Spirochaetaceae bacterium]
MPDPIRSALPDSFHPLVRSWFAERYGEPTPVQAAAWPVIASGGHVLASAPTGSGKTLTAFLGALSRFATGEYPPDGLSALYVSPLKALNEDVRLNLLEPARELAAWFRDRGEAFPRLKIASRSGDTSQSERRGMIARPPSILCVTPESLAIMIASRSGLAMLGSVRLLILDELHAVLGTKRGAALACSVGRLALLAGEFQRVALSATVEPFETAARFAAGSRLVRAPDGSVRYEPRTMAVVAPPAAKRYELSVAWPAARPLARPPTAGPDDREADEPSGRYDAIADDLAERLARERSTVVFADSRRRAERLAAMLNERSGDGTAWAHHGSLSKDVRKAVEARLKAGRLRCVVATGTLELGIDVGAIGLVALAGSPQRADQLLQRAGRSGHRVGLASRAVVYPFHGLDLLAAAAAVGAALDRDLDPLSPPREPLDLLAQVLLSMVLFEERRLDELYDEVRSFPPYAALARADFDAVVGMLSGRFAGSRVKELSGRAYLDEERGALRAKEGAAMLLYSAGGSIPDRGYYAMRLADGTRLGELDEEFVFERRVGNSFSFGTQAWRIVDIGDEAVTVAPLDRDADFMPFWKAEKAARGASVSRRMLELCAAFDAAPDGFGAALRERSGFSPEAAEALVAFLSSQSRAQKGAGLPSPGSVVVEAFRDPSAKAGATALIVHTLRGSAVNEPLGMALSSLLRDKLGLPVERLSNDDSVSLSMPFVDRDEAVRALTVALRSLAEPAVLSAALRDALAGSAVFGAAFRENAGRALLLPRSGFGRRTPLWVTRLRAKRLLERTSGCEGFPIATETWKTVLEQRFDLASLSSLCAGLADGSVAAPVFSPAAPSPFARHCGWAETNRYLYDDDGSTIYPNGTPAVGAAGAAEAAIARAMSDPAARPRVDPALASAYGARLRRELPGWAPSSPDGLADWVDERLAIPLDEWESLLAACPEGLREAAGAAIAAPGTGPGLLSRLEALTLPGASEAVVVRREGKAALLESAGRPDGRASLAARWLPYAGPVSLDRLGSVFGPGAAEPELLEAAGVVVGPGLGARPSAPDGASDGKPAGEVQGACDRDVLESLLRQGRAAARPKLRAMPAAALPAFVAALQGLRDRALPDDERYASDRQAGVAATRRALEALSGFPAPAALWETEILPARVPDYRPEYLDELLADGEFIWFGAGERVVAFASAADYEAFAPGRPSSLLSPGDGPLDAWAVKDRHGLSIAELEERLWAEIWAGAIGSDGFEAVRRAAGRGFRRSASAAGAADTAERPARGRPVRVPTALRARWKDGPPLAGTWFALALDDEGPADEADRLELDCRAVRAVVRRYGVVFPAMLERELPRARWGGLARALRRMELSGELSCGRFFDGPDGPQFIGADALRVFKDGFDGGLASMNACDPASPAGWAVEGLPEGLPSRLPANRLSLSGGEPVCVARRSWRDLELSREPGDPMVARSLAFALEARRRTVSPERRIAVASINGESAASSPYAGLLAWLGFEADRGVMTLW